MLYNIGGLWIYFEGENDYFEERCAVFKRDAGEKTPEECDMRIFLELVDNLQRPEGDTVFGGQEASLIRKAPPDSGFYYFGNDFIMATGERKEPSIMDANPEWSDIKLRYTKNSKAYVSKDDGTFINWNHYSSFLSIGIAFRNHIVKKNGIQIHCSSIDYQGTGLLFSAPSGTGKSTHMRLWRELYKDDVTIINEDRPVIRYMNNIPMLCGTPWSGTSDSFANKIVPLKTIVMLEQAPTNSIEKLSGGMVLQLLMPRCFMPYFDSELMVEATTTLEKLITDVPVYLLKCRPDYEAVELVRSCLT
jgi:hypothetical protein